MKAFCMAVLIGLLPTTSALADGDPDQELKDLRRMVETLRSDYEQRINELERRLEAAERRAEQAETVADEARETAEDLAYAPQESRATSPAAFNPAIGAVLVGSWSNVGIGEDDYEFPGFMLGPESGPVADGLSLGETELNFSANIDDKFFGNLTFALHDHEGELEVELEEAFIQTTALPAGLQLTGGRFFSGIGYLNQFHRHADDFADRPLPYQAFLGGQYLDDGLQLRWLAPTPFYLELGAELMRGERFPAAGAEDGAGARTLFASTGGDIGLSHSWKAGISWLAADVGGRAAGHAHEEDEEAHEDDEHEEEELTEAFSGDSDLWGLDFVYKWAPDGNPALRNFTLQGEYYQRDEKGTFGEHLYRGDQDGWYLQGVYQFRPGWRFGYRHDALSADNRGVDETELDDLGFSPRRDSLMLEWYNSEFSRVLLQYTRDRSTLDDDNQLQLRYIMSIGAHRAHQY